MNIYAESSAVVAWLLREPAGLQMDGLLASATHVISSDLTLIECDRAIHRAHAIGRMRARDAKSARAELNLASTKWDVLGLLGSVVDRARQRFSAEPIRSLDALHVSWALHARTAIPDLAMLSLDDRVRRVAESVRLPVLPG